jgi:hypothetical protein
MKSKYSIGIYFMAMLTTRDKAPRVQQVALIPSDNLAVPMNFEPSPVSPKLTIKYWMVISIAKTAQYVGLLRIVLKMFNSVTSFVSIILQCYVVSLTVVSDLGLVFLFNIFLDTFPLISQF